MFNLNGKKNIRVDLFFVVSHGETRSTFALATVTYHGASHHITRVIKEDKVWFHDGIETGNLLVEESILSATDLAACCDCLLTNILCRIHLGTTLEIIDIRYVALCSNTCNDYQSGT